ncbi:MAG: hypothetical protein IJD91_06725 [Clostridia bacterium]|nr:hypothetical protein [Clostridia bacterium]
MYKYLYDIRYSNFKDFDNVKVSTVLDAIQEVAIRNSEYAGFGINKLRKMDRAWLLQGMNVCFEKGIKTSFPIEAYTAVKSLKGVVSERGCIIMQNGETVAKSIANWCLLDTKRMRLAKVPEEMTNAYEHCDFDNDTFFIYERPEIIEDASALYKVRVSNKELDTNMHLNNQKGAELLMDALPFDFEIKKISLIYPNPAYLGEELDVCVAEIENGYYVHLKNQDGKICVAGTFEGR